MISIIIPVYNGAASIGICLSSLMGQKYPDDYEIIVVNDGSTDNTGAIVNRYPEVRLISQANRGPAAARNLGAKHAKGKIIVFTDADCEASATWVAEMTRPFREIRDVVGVKGSYKTRQKGITARFVQLEYEDKYDVMMKEPYIDFIDTYAAAFKRDVFMSAGGFDENFPVACAEDVDLSFRLARQGSKMVFNPKAWVYHSHPEGINVYLRKKYKFAYWRVMALCKSPDKIIKDSHTPQVMKLQVLLFPIILMSFLFGFIRPDMALLLATVYVLTTLPFMIKAIYKDTLVGLLSPIILFLRSGAQSAGLVGGFIQSRRLKC